MTPERVSNIFEVKVYGVVIELPPNVDPIIGGIESVARKLIELSEKYQYTEMSKKNNYIYPESTIKRVMLVVPPVEINKYASMGPGYYALSKEGGWLKLDNLTLNPIEEKEPNKRLFEAMRLNRMRESIGWEYFQEFIDGVYLRQRLISHAKKPEVEEHALGVMRSNNSVIVNRELTLRLLSPKIIQTTSVNS